MALFENRLHMDFPIGIIFPKNAVVRIRPRINTFTKKNAAEYDQAQAAKNRFTFDNFKYGDHFFPGLEKDGLFPRYDVYLKSFWFLSEPVPNLPSRWLSGFWEDTMNPG